MRIGLSKSKDKGQNRARVESRRRHCLTLTLFRRGRIIHGATCCEDAGQRSPVWDVATIVR